MSTVWMWRVVLMDVLYRRASTIPEAKMIFPDYCPTEH